MPTLRPYVHRRNRQPRPNLAVSPPVFNRVVSATHTAHGNGPTIVTFQNAIGFQPIVVFQTFLAITENPRTWSVAVIGDGTEKVEWWWDIESNPPGFIYDPDIDGALTLVVLNQLPPDSTGGQLQMGQVIEVNLV